MTPAGSRDALSTSSGATAAEVGREPSESASARRLRERLERVTEEARAMSRILPHAVGMSAQSGGLAEALVPAVERSLTLSGRRDPRILGGALVPAIGIAIRRSLAGSVQRSFLALNRWMLKYASVTGLRWRLEARRTGRTFAEVFHAHTRRLPVKQVFLIHRETGILLQQVQSEVDPSRDWDVVSGMLTAIGDFIHDSFNTSADAGLETIRVGDLTIVIEQGRYAALAGILRGDEPADLRERLRTVLDRVHGEFAHALEQFDGETAVFEASGTVLESCLQALVTTENRHILPQTFLAAAIPPLLLLALLAYQLKDVFRWERFVHDVAAQPGLVVLREGRANGRYFIYGLRDPLAVDPVKLILAHGLYIGDIDSRWAPYQSADAMPTLSRLTELLNPPESVQLTLDGGGLVLSGSAPQSWIDGALAKLPAIGGLAGYRTDGLTASDLAVYRRWDQFLQRVDAEPGLVILKSGAARGRFYIDGLRDPLARDPNVIMASVGLTPADIDSRWEPYHALHPALTLERAREVLVPPETVTLDLRDGVLVLKGRASYKWIDRALVLARAVAGVKALNLDQLVDEDLEQLNAVRAAIEAERFRFLVGAPDLWPGQGSRLEAVVANLDKLQRLARRRGQVVTIEVRGHTDASGDPQRDARDSMELANSFLENLRWRGLDMSNYRKRPMGSVLPPNSDAGAREANNRVVSLKTLLADE